MNTHRGQGATEYLVILGAVLLVSIVTVNILSSSAPTASIKEQQSKAYWAASTPFTISTSKITPTSITLSVTNKLEDRLYLTAIEIRDASGNTATIMKPNEIFNIGEEIVLSNASFTTLNPCTGKSSGSEYEINFVSFVYTQGLLPDIRQQGTKSFVGRCSQDIAIGATAILGVTPPETWNAPVSSIAENDQFTGTVTWSPANATFVRNITYTATINLTPKAGYVLTDVAANSFTVAGATTVTNAAGSGVVTAAFPPATCGGLPIKLDSANTVYTMTSNCDARGGNGHTIRSENITLDCNGHTVFGNSTIGSIGIYSNITNVTIKNCNVSFFDVDILVNSTTNNTITNTTVFLVNGSQNLWDNSAYFAAIMLQNTNYSTIINTASTVFGVDVWGAVYLYEANNNTVINTTGVVIGDNSNGFCINGGTHGSASNFIINSTAHMFLGYVTDPTYMNWNDNVYILSGATNNTIQNFYGTSTGNATYEGDNENIGIYVLASNNNTIINATTLVTGSVTLGIKLSNANNTKVINSTAMAGYDITDPTIDSRSYGILAADSNNVEVTNSNGTGTGGWGDLPCGGIAFYSVNNSRIYNSTGYDNHRDGSGIVSYYSNNVTVDKSNGSSPGMGYLGIFYANTHNSIISNSIGIAGNNGNATIGYDDAGYAIDIDDSENDTIINCTGIAGEEGANEIYGIYVARCNNTSIINSNGTATFGTSGIGLGIGNTRNGGIYNSTGIASYLGLYVPASNNSVIFNNTLVAPLANALLSIDAESRNITSCLNNFRPTTGVYVDDTGIGNNYNCTYGGKNQGNIWPNVINNSVAITTSGVTSSIPGYYIGTGGAGYPYNQTTAQGKFVCSYTRCGDYAPLLDHS